LVSSVRVFAGRRAGSPCGRSSGAAPSTPTASGAPAPARRVALRSSVPRARPTRDRAADAWHPSTSPGSLAGACRRSRGSSPPRTRGTAGGFCTGLLLDDRGTWRFGARASPPMVTAAAAGATAPFGGSGASLAVGCAVDAPSPVRTPDPGGAVRRIAPGDPYSTFCALLCASKYHCGRLNEVAIYITLRIGLNSGRAGARTIGTSRRYVGGYKRGTAHEGSRIGGRDHARGEGAEYDRRNRYDLRLAPARSGWHMPGGQKIRKRV
jgi:hypothetical protein